MVRIADSIGRSSCAFVLAALAGAGTPSGSGGEPAAGAPEGRGLALFARKLLIAAADGPDVLDNGVVLVRDGRIEAVAERRGFQVPEGYEVLDLGDPWLAPGLVELHCHVAAGLQDLSEADFLTNPEMRVSVGVRSGF